MENDSNVNLDENPGSKSQSWKTVKDHKEHKLDLALRAQFNMVKLFSKHNMSQ